MTPKTSSTHLPTPYRELPNERSRYGDLRRTNSEAVLSDHPDQRSLNYPVRNQSTKGYQTRRPSNSPPEFSRSPRRLQRGQAAAISTTGLQSLRC
jgi:hypothetical protein